MSPDLLTGILWIPFAVVALIAGLVYCIRGYRRGLWHALISLGAVVLSTVASVLLSRLIASFAAPALAAVLPLDMGADASAAAVKMLLESVISVAVSMLLFGLLMLIFTPVIGAIAGKCLKKHLPDADQKMKWLGLAAGLVSALVFTLFWLSPVYGTLAAAAPVAGGVLSMQEDDTAGEYADYVDGISDHLLVQVSGAGPVGWVYDGVSRVSVGGASVSVLEMSNAVNEAMLLIDQLQRTDDPAQIAKISEKLIDLTRKTFVDQDWFYKLSQDLVDELKVMAEDSTMSDIAYIRALLELAEMPKSEFQQTAAAVLDFAKFALSKGVMTMTEDSDPMAIYESGLLQEMGRVLNSSDRLVQMKKLVLGLMLEEVGLEFEDAMALLETYQVGRLTEAEDQLLEVEALLLPGLGRDIPPAIMILRHPSLGEAALEDVQKTVSFARLMGYWDDELDLTETERQAVLNEVKKAAKLPFEEAAKLDTGLGDMMNMAQSAVDYRD